MGFLTNFIDVFLHLDKHLGLYMEKYGIFIYVILFIIIFCETGLVVTPFLPGDSLIFATGALAAAGSIAVGPVFIVFCVAAILGDTVNYSIGHYLKDKVAAKQNIRFIKREYIERTDAFFKKHGGKTIILARFIPIIRTFAPFVAGVGTMHYKRFLMFNAIGGISWVTIALLTGYFFGNIPFVKDNFSMVIIGIVVVSMVPMVYAFIKNKVDAKRKQKV